ncbi:MAG TPA: hypothetical protein VM684_12335 [Gaiellales bacterium]|nr:hypothetical protein [Gaiellales bacterium]
MSAQPGEGTEIPDDLDIHTTTGKLADLDRRLDEVWITLTEAAGHGPDTKR